MQIFEPVNIARLSGLGLIVGLMGSLFGIGGGVIIVPALVMMAGLSQKEAQGISLGVMVPMALMSFFRYYRMPDLNIDLKMVLVLAVAAVIGANIGTTVVGSISNRTLQTGFGILIIGIGVLMVVKAR